MRFAVDADGFGKIIGLAGDDLDTIGDGGGDDVGQVILTLGIVVGECCQPCAQFGGRGHQDAGIDFLDGELGGAGILLFDDAYQAALFAHDASVAGGVVEIDGQHTELVVTGGRQQTGKGGAGSEWHIAV